MIENTQWEDRGKDGFYMSVLDADGHPVRLYIGHRPVHCDRGHLMLIVDGRLNLDPQDGFPRYFFSFNEADKHARAFLAWRIWKKRIAV